MTQTDDEIIQEMARELAAKTEPMQIVMRAFTVMQLTGLVQLACRHSAVSREHRAVAALFLDNVRAYFADCPTMLEVMRRGDDPAQDR